jgi:two-component system CheB/CheR fusion protein
MRKIRSRAKTAGKVAGRKRRAKPASFAAAAKGEARIASAAPKIVSSTRDAAIASPVIAVGASAGGLEAFSQILERLPPDIDAAFVFIQHLSPQHASNLTELLAAKSSLEVVTAASGTRIEPGRVYVMPPNVHMEVVDGELHLIPRPTDRSQFTPIDFFMQSVARWAQERTIGVILSGTASDGSAGIREIKAFGGIAIAQAPETAKHDGMPRAALATGIVDLVLSPADIAERLGQFRHHPYLRADSADPADQTLTEHQMRDLFMMLRRASGIDFKQYKAPTVRRRLLRRMALLRLTELDAYLRHVLEVPAEAKALAQDLLIHVTRFFRDPDAYETMTAQVFPELLRDRGDEPIRIWVPGCATGEEAYSIGIRLIEALGDRASDRRVQLFATDVSDSAIEQARSGFYPATISADVSAERLKRFFTRSDGGYRIIKTLRDMCVFARHDLTRDPPFSRLDFIVCRNVLIYLDTALQRRLISVFHYALKARGFLMLGPAETAGQEGLFAPIDKKWRLFRKLPADMGLPPSARIDHLTGPRGTAAVAHARISTDGKSVQDEATRVILDRFGPPAVVVDGNFDIVQFRGHTGPYLEAASGEPNLSLLKMARGGLLHPLRTALNEAARRSRVVRKAGVHIHRNGEWIDIALEIVPLTSSRGEHYLVLFDETDVRVAKGRKGGTRRKPATSARAEADTRVAALRRELAANREYLQSIIQELEAANEELQSANEEILSSNEEMQSTNEELDTAKEELQSTNEELNTVNEELHSRNDDLTRANSDLTNLLGSVDIPIVIVDNELAIRRFTPRAEQLFNLISGDVGRPIGQINPNFVCEDLERLIRQTIDAVAPRELEVQDKAGRWMSLRIRPYKALDNRLDGAVLSVIDIDASKRHQAVVEISRNQFRSMIDAVRQPMLILDHRGRVRAANRAFCKTFDVTPIETEGQEITKFADGRWGGTVIAELFDDVRKAGKTVERLAVVEFPRAGRRSVRLTGDPLPVGDPGPEIVIAIEDRGNGDGQA